MILADWSAVFVDAIFDNPDQYGGLAIFGVLFYTIQLYADFSGGMDVVIGIASMFGIELDENFTRRFCNVYYRLLASLAYYIRNMDERLSVLSFVSFERNGQIRQVREKDIWKDLWTGITNLCSNIVVFLVVGIWHGAAWKFIVYGLYNGIIIGFSGLMAKNYRDWKKKLKINDKSNGWHIFQIIRTFILVNISWFFDRADTIPQAFTMMKNAVTVWKPMQIFGIHEGPTSKMYMCIAICVLVLGCIVLFVVSFMQERGVVFENTKIKSPLLKCAVYLVLVITLAAFSLPSSSAGGFIYAQF